MSGCSRGPALASARGAGRAGAAAADPVGVDDRRLRDDRAHARAASDAAAAALAEPGTASIGDLARLPHNTSVKLGGLVVARQRPGTAKGIVFLLLEDEFGTINLIVRPTSMR